MSGYFVCISLSGVAFDAAMMYRICITVHMYFLYISIVNNRWRESEDHKASGTYWGHSKKYSAVLCDRRVRVKLKGKVYKTMNRPAMLYGVETWATTKRQ